MVQRRAGYPSALKSGVTHLALSASIFTVFTLSVAGTLNLFGNAEDAGPVITVALFEPSETAADLNLKTRLRDPSLPDLQIAAMRPMGERPVLEEPSLGVEYRAPSASRQSLPRQPRTNLSADAASVSVGANPARRAIARMEEGSSAEPRGVRINGRTVLPGEAFSAVRVDETPAAEAALTRTETPSRVASLDAKVSGPAPADKYARPFENPTGQPAVSIVLGGLGLNYTHTKTAISELPPEITLAFSPHTRGLKTWITRARDAGHEVLIEVPMEASEYGRVKPHPLTLKSGVSEDALTARLDRFLATASGYFGVINYQGDKFAQDTGLAGAVVEHVHARGLAFIEDGNLTGSSFEIAAAGSAARYARAHEVIDTRIETSAMQDKLMALETRAKENGTALGTAIAYPISIDALRDWATTLESRGLVLAPASHTLRLPAPSTPAEPATPSLFNVSGGEVEWEVLEPRPFATPAANRSGGE
ncbi:MAG: divergent polysaccharide deacetylase family protein [Pseudomonadota bacterium]